MEQGMHRDRRVWRDSRNFKKRQRRPGIEFTGSEKNGGHQPPLRTPVFELNPQSATASHLAFPTLCGTKQPSRDGEYNKPLANAFCFCCTWKAPSPSQPVNSGHICCVAGTGTVRR